jgi:hypothetical protein
VTYHANTAPQEAWHAIVSEDRGATWLPLFVLRTPALPGASYMGSLACGPGGTASFVWPDARSGAVELYSTRFAGTSWTADVPGATPPGSSPKWPSATFSSAGTAVVAYEAGSGEVYVSRSVDGGATYSSFARLDGTAPDPTAPSRAVRTIADGSGNVWARFLDRSGGLDRIVARSSVDDGLTWGTLRRLSVEYSGASREDAVGADYWIEGDAAAAAGNAYFVWGGNRFSPFPDPLINIWDADDLDRDGQSSGTDCNDLDPSVQLAPVEVSGVVVGKDSGAAVISWQSQSGAGSATTYDIVGGSVVSLRSMGGFGGALCRAEDFPGSTFGDPTTLPVGDGWYYLIRASNACGIGAYGDSSLVPDPRDALSSAPCM